MKLDAFTVMVASGTAVVLLGVQLLLFWSSDRRSNWLIWFASTMFLGGCSVMLFTLRGRASDALTVGVANAIFIGVFAIVWQAIRLFDRRKPLILPTVVAPAVWLLLYGVPEFTESLALRVVVSSLMVGTFLLLSATELWRGREERLSSRLPAAAVLLSFALFVLMRIPMVSVAPFPFGALAFDVTWMGIWALVSFAHICMICMLVVALTKERREHEQRGYAMSDPLTGLLNRRAFASQVDRMARSPDEPGRVVVMALDLDHFKQINDSHGHTVGDRLLTAFASVAQSSLRTTDLLYRMGGEEFCFLLPGATPEEAVRVAENLRRAFEASIVDAHGEFARTTVSIGISASESGPIDLDLMHSAADAALYEAKARGRNRIVMAGPDAIPLRPRLVVETRRAG